MKKIGVLSLVLLLSFILVPLVFSQSNQTNSTQTGSTTQIEDAFTCLEEKVDDCTGLTTHELAVTILSTPKESTFSDCVNELKSRVSSNNWGNIKDTSLAILALNHAGLDTVDYESWILEQTQDPTELIWFLEQDSNTEVDCNIDYDTSSYPISIGENKKINSDAGTCLKRAQSNFWLRIEPSCYGTEFQVSCNQDFILAALYKNRNSPTIYVLEGTHSAPLGSKASLIVKSKCFGTTSCEYESSVWAVRALLETGHDVEEYIPYIIAMAETNKRYLPDTFLYMITGYDDYATRLIEDQKLGNFWLADSSAYNKFYDTALALLAVGDSSSEKVIDAKGWLLFSQGNNGCWQNSILDTAMILWALEGRAGRTVGGGSGGSSTTYCTQANFFCVPRGECSSPNDVSNNYFCSGLTNGCCKEQELKTCSEYAGEVCTGSLSCSGNKRPALDTNECCTGSCVERPTETECESNFYSCRDSCLSNQETKAFSCTGSDICCGTKSSSGEDDEGIPIWIWILILAIVVVGAVIIYVLRDKIFKKSKAKEGPGPPGSRPMGPGGFPPRRPPMRPRPGPRPPMTRRPIPGRQAAPPRRRPVPARKDKDMSDTFKKLQEISK